MEAGLGPGHVVLGSAPPTKKGAEPPPQFSARVYCGQTSGYIKMALGMEVGLGPGYIVLDGEPAPLPKREQSSPIFGPFLLSPNGWMNQDGTWHGGGPWSKPHCARWGPSSPPQKGGRPPIFGPFLLSPNGWMHQDATWYGNTPRPRPHCIRRGPSSARKGHSSPIFSAHVCCGHGRPSQLLLSSCTSFGINFFHVSLEHHRI